MFNVTCENQRRADERIPILLELPFKHKGIMYAPFVCPISIQKCLPTGQIEQVLCVGEDYDGARPCHYEWVKKLHDEYRKYTKIIKMARKAPVLARAQKASSAARTFLAFASCCSAYEQAHRAGLSGAGEVRCLDQGGD